MATRKADLPVNRARQALDDSSNGEVLEIVSWALEEMAQRCSNAADLVVGEDVPLEAITDAHSFTQRAWALMPSGAFLPAGRLKEAWHTLYDARGDVASALAGWSEREAGVGG